MIRTAQFRTSHKLVNIRSKYLQELNESKHVHNGYTNWSKLNNRMKYRYNIEVDIGNNMNSEF